MLACDAKVRHSVEALSEAVCLLNVETGSERRGSARLKNSVSLKDAAVNAADLRRSDLDPRCEQ